MLRKIALATITVAALVAPPSLVQGYEACGECGANGVSVNGSNLNGHNLNGHNLKGVYVNGVSVNGLKLNGVEPAGREVYFVGEQAGGESSTVLTIELPQDHVTR